MAETKGTKTKAHRKKVGRPSDYSAELAEAICRRIAEGESVRAIVKDEAMPAASTIFRWLLDETKKEFWEQYARARNIQAELMFEELLDIADETNGIIKKGAEKKSGAYAQSQRLRVDTRKWYLSKVLPKKFGEKLDVTSGGESLAALIALANGDAGGSATP